MKTAEHLQILIADLHIHTCLSPCASLDMTPLKIIRETSRKNLSAIAITDHNSAENVSAVIVASRDTGVFVIPGIEVATSEEAHIIGLFAEVTAAISMQELVYDHLLPGENDEDLFGLQVVANQFDEVEEINKRLLIGATDLRLEEVVTAIHEREGLAVAAHIDRETFSIPGQLGFIPEDLELDALEISRHLTLDEARVRFSEYERFPFITTSDAHDLGEIGTSPIRLRVAQANMTELKRALTGREGRSVLSGYLAG